MNEPIPSLTTKPSRRTFLHLLWIALGWIAVGEGLWVIGSFFTRRPYRKGEGGAEPVIAGTVTDFALASVTAFRQAGFYLVRLEDSAFLALPSRCPHLGCRVTWQADEGRFACPCHASLFDRRGEVIRAPAPRALDYFPVIIENRQIKVDIRRPQRRSRFHPNQTTLA